MSAKVSKNLFKSVAIKTTVLDTNAKYLGTKTSKLMENAGKGVCQELVKKYPKNTSFAFICGLGNNGGDGFATALELSKQGIKPVVYLIGKKQEIKTAESLEFFEKIEKDKNVKVVINAQAEDIQKSDVFIECLVGTGIRGKMRNNLREVIQKINKGKVVAIDMPLPGYEPDLTISLDYAKTENCVVVDIDIPKEAEKFTGPGDVKALWKPKADSYKYQNGEVLIYAGSKKFHGAPLMAIKTAAKLVGSVFYYTSPENRKIADNLKLEIPEFIVLTDNNLEKYAEYANAFLCGPGLEPNLPTKAIIKELIKRGKDKPMVLDAYAIAVAQEKERLLAGNIITPHIGELRHFFPEGQIPESKKEIETGLIEFATKNRCYVVLTGQTDILVHKNGTIAYNNNGNEGMAKGGTGDVFAGLLTALLAKNDPWLAMRAATFINGMAGDNLFKKFGPNYSATELIDEIRNVIRWCEEY